MSEINTTTTLYENDKQFLRFAEVTVKNFKKEEKIVIGNDFEIEFDYFKTLDQTKEDDSGKITIYGLTKETISLLEEEGGEVWLRCGYQLTGIAVLFIAHISRVYSERSNNTTATTIECSANLLTHFYSGYVASSDNIEIPLRQLLQNFAVSLGYATSNFNLDNIPKGQLEVFKKFLNTYKTNYYTIGDIRTVMEQVCEHFGLASQRALTEENEDALVYSFTDLGIKKVSSIISKGYPALDLDKSYAEERQGFFLETLYSTRPEDATLGVLLTKDTGLIEAQNEYQIISAFQNQKLNSNERETAESVYKRNNIEQKNRISNLQQGELQPSSSNNNKEPVGGDNSNPYVSNDRLRGLRIKPDLVPNTNIRESTGGGDIRLETAALAFKVQELLGSELIRFTGFNDYYHQQKSPSSLHTQGKSFDFTVTTGHKGAPSVRNKVEALAKSLNLRVNVDDEYNFPSSKATAPHIHVDVYGKGVDSSPSTLENSVNTEKESESKKKDGDPYGRIPIEIVRRYNRITAFLNPLVKPQSIVYTKDDETDSLVVHRVRHATYAGNNKRNAWTMLLYCEDTGTSVVSSNNVDSTPQEKDLAPESVANQE